MGSRDASRGREEWENIVALVNKVGWGLAMRLVVALCWSIVAGWPAAGSVCAPDASHGAFLAEWTQNYANNSYLGERTPKRTAGPP